VNNPHEGDNIGMRITDERSGKKLFYAPGLGEIEPHLKPLLEEADAIHGRWHLLDRR
jgi:pyrroloquinoline quinone biosynthesis protein B